MILEGLLTTINEGGGVNISPMGPAVEEDMRRLVLKPYQTSRTYQNLKRTGEGVFHVTDDVELMARCAIGTPDPLPPMMAAEGVNGRILANACRWYAFRVTSLDDSQERTQIVADVVAWARIRDFFGFNRAKHAVVEAAILATRTALLPVADILRDFERLQVLVNKTGGPQEHRAFDFLRQQVQAALGDDRK